MMFGFGNRKKYNGTIDTKLNNEYRIDTRNDSDFPNVNGFLEAIDMAWRAKMSEDEGALYIATLFYCSLVENGKNDKASAINKRIREIAKFGIEKGMISTERWRKFSSAMSDTNAKYQKSTGVDSYGEACKLLANEFGVQIDDIPDPKSTKELFYSMASDLSKEAQVSLLYRLVVMNYLGAAKVMSDNGEEIETGDLEWLTAVSDSSVEWSERSNDKVELENLTTPLNQSIIRFFQYFGISQGSQA